MKIEINGKYILIGGSVVAFAGGGWWVYNKYFRYRPIKNPFEEQVKSMSCEEYAKNVQELQIQTPPKEPAPVKKVDTRSLSQKIFEDISHNDSAGVNDEQLIIQYYTRKIIGDLFSQGQEKANKDGYQLCVYQAGSEKRRPPQFDPKTIYVQIEDFEFNVDEWLPSENAIITDVLSVGKI